MIKTNNDNHSADCAVEKFKKLIESFISSILRVRKPNVTAGLSPNSICAEGHRYSMYFRVKPPSAVGWNESTIVICRAHFLDCTPEYSYHLLKAIIFQDSVEYDYIGFEAFDEDSKLIEISNAELTEIIGNYLVSRVQIKADFEMRGKCV